ncbi:translation initiation factor IF-2-like [Hordeum vulgare]|nr:translation initiation factor IF-2-like [Hordeum vulgare]
MVRWHRNREKGKAALWEITPHYAEKLEVEKEMARFCKPIQNGVNLWHVTSGQQTHVVNLEVHTCSFRKWDLYGIPCNHAISAINKAKIFLEEYVSKIFKNPFYLASYHPMIYLVPGEHDCTRTSAPDIEPPTFHVKRGRKKEKRIKGKFEVPKIMDSSKMATITCSNCGLQGHSLQLQVHSLQLQDYSLQLQDQGVKQDHCLPCKIYKKVNSSASVHRPFPTPRFAAGGSSAVDGGSSSAPAPRFAAGGSSSSLGGSSASPTPTNHSGWMAFFTTSGNHN